MTTLIRKSAVGSLVAVALVLSACGGGSATTGVEAKLSQSFPVDPDVTVTVSTYNGTIEVKSGGDDRVEVEVTKRGGGLTDAAAKDDLDDIQLSLAQAGGEVKLVATHQGPVPANSAASFVVTVPAGATLDLSVDNGTITSNGVKGAVTATADNGDITVRGVEENPLTARATNGAVTLEGKDVSSVVASTTNGAASFSGSIADSDAANRIEVGNGNVTLKLPGDAQFGIDAQTSNGTLTTNFTFEGDTTPKSVKGTVGDSPGFGIVIRVQNGNIAIEKQ